jgi:hypothetical protein
MDPGGGAVPFPFLSSPIFLSRFLLNHHFRLYKNFLFINPTNLPFLPTYLPFKNI